MKNSSQHLIKLIAASFLITVFAACATHKKEKCNTCPKWSKAETQSTSAGVRL